MARAQRDEENSPDKEEPTIVPQSATFNKKTDVSTHVTLTKPAESSSRIPSTELITWNEPSTSDNSVRSIQDLPDEILEYIFSFLDFVQRIKIELVCKRWLKLGKCPKQLQIHVDFIPNRKMNDNMLGSILARCGQTLKELQLMSNTDLTCESLMKIGEYCHQLEVVELHLIGTPQISCLKTIALGCPSLKVVKLENDMISTTDDVGGFESENDTDCCNDGDNDNDDNNYDDNGDSTSEDDVHIEENDYETCNDAYNEGLLAIAESCKKLECLHISGLGSVASNWLGVINPNLQSISLHNTGLTPGGLQCLMQRCTALQEFNLDSCGSIDQHVLFEFLTHFKQTLTVLRVTYEFDWFLDWRSVFQDLVNLKVLSLFACDLVDDALMVVLAKNCVQLTCLNIGATDVTDVGLIALQGLPKLKHLKITHQNSITGYGLESLVARGILQLVTIPPRESLEAVCNNLSKTYPHVRFMTAELEGSSSEDNVNLAIRTADSISQQE